MIVVDTSVALKWVLRAPGTDLAKRALALPLIAPDFWRVEAANGIRRAVAMKQATEEEGRHYLAVMDAAPVDDAATAPLLRGGFELAMTLRHSIQDCLFLALAIERDCRLLTADDTFTALVRDRSNLSDRVVPLSEYFQ
ncbi:type II toxin-antitoxin system VapC family toxin [Brevundimonas bacteroides]|uniref:type II toxin-antitoxin system VapC family toxin n=1 Tax=Brevundimonas bacteroides TaxID=74311 RepID=UPI00068EC95A|nr:type II toxin-antitoxin system VapC family toxin [Brevundimonas bacteroides]